MLVIRAARVFSIESLPSVTLNSSAFCETLSFPCAALASRDSLSDVSSNLPSLTWSRCLKASCSGLCLAINLLWLPPETPELPGIRVRRLSLLVTGGVNRQSALRFWASYRLRGYLQRRGSSMWLLRSLDKFGASCCPGSRRYAGGRQATDLPRDVRPAVLARPTSSPGKHGANRGKPEEQHAQDGAAQAANDH